MPDLLNHPDVRKKLGVDRSVGNFTSCSDDVSYAFFLALDFHRSSRAYTEQLLERGVRVLQYVGTCDFACSWVRC